MMSNPAEKAAGDRDALGGTQPSTILRSSFVMRSRKPIFQFAAQFARLLVARPCRERFAHFGSARYNEYMAQKQIVPLEAVANRIFIFRGQRVILDSDLAALYGVPTKRLNEQVKRNAVRFPEDFMFQLSLEELAHWRSQIATSNPGAKMGLRRPPYAFAEHGAIMAATVLNSDKAVEMSLFVVRAFVRLRNLLATNKELAAQLKKLERRLDMSDEAIAEIYAMVRQLMTPPDPPRRRIGF